jgi:hypothetical protein
LPERDDASQAMRVAASAWIEDEGACAPQG